MKKPQIKNIVASFRRTANDFPAFFRSVGKICDALLRVPVPPSPQIWLELGRVSHVVHSLADRLADSLDASPKTDMPPQEASHEPIDPAFLDADLTTLHAMIASAATNLMRIAFVPYGDGVVVTPKDVARLDSFRVLILTTGTIADQVVAEAKAALSELQRRRDEGTRDLN